jgi:tetratricopeptide (TPR) repeat protein
MESAMSKGQLQHTQFNIKGVLFKEAYHNGTPGLIIAESLYDIFEYWAKNQNEYFPYGKDNISILPQLQDSIYDHYGEYLPFSMTALNGKGWEFFGEKKYAKAIDIWKVLLKQYPNLAEFYLYIASAQKELNQPYDDTLDKFLKLLKVSHVYSADEKEELLQELEKLKID